MLFLIIPVTDIFIPRRVVIDPSPLTFAILELPVITRGLVIVKYSLPIFFVVPEITDILFAVLVMVLALAIFEIILETSFVF